MRIALPTANTYWRDTLPGQFFLASWGPISGGKGDRNVENPIISVIVPIYKVEPYLRKCLNSIVGQTYRNLEIILVDDGSPDGCPVICDEYAARDKRIKVIHQANGGVSAARNAGLAEATGDWVGWVDSDDWIEPDMYEYMLKNALKYGADIAVCGRVERYPERSRFWVWEDTQVLDREQALEKLLENKLMGNYLCDKLWRRELFQGIVFPMGRTFEDIAIAHRLFLRAKCVVCLPEAKYNYLQHPGSIVANAGLLNRWNHYAAAKERYDEMQNDWPQFEPLLATQCVTSATGLWCSYCTGSEEERKRLQSQLPAMSSFCKKHITVAQERLGLGLAGRIVLRLTSHAKPWAFSLARLVSKLYEWKHGNPL